MADAGRGRGSWTRRVSRLVFAGAMLVATGCAATWECTAPDGEVVAADTLSCASYRGSGDQVLEQARDRCAADLGEACACAFVRVSCGGGRTND